VTRVGPFSEMIGAEMQRRSDEGFKPLEWIVVRNRRNPSATRHTAAIGTVLGELSRNLSFRVTDGFVDRLIFRELFLVGLSILDLRKDDPLIANNSSHKSAYTEASNLLQSIGKSFFTEGARAERLTGGDAPALVDARLVRRRRVKPADGLEAPPHLDAERIVAPAPAALAPKAPTREAQTEQITNGAAEIAVDTRARDTESPAPPAAEASAEVAPQANGSAESLAHPASVDGESDGNSSRAELLDRQPAPAVETRPATDLKEETPPALAPVAATQPEDPGAQPLPGPRGKILVIYDSTGGRRHRLRFRATLSRLARLGCVVSVHECHGPMDGKAFFRDINISEYGAILVAGSDTSLMALAGPLAASGLPVAIASPQSSRHLASELGLSLTPKAIAERTIEGAAREWYLAEANNCPFVSFATVGLAADLSFGPRQRRAALATAGAGSKGDDGYRIVVDGRYRDVAGAFVVNAQFLPRDFASIEGAVRGEPKLYAVMLERGGWRDRLRFRSALMAGRLPRAKGVIVEAAEQISIWGAAGEAIFVEGEAICTLPAQIRIMRRPITILS
ncbi:MAG: division plane positioning ATPase MipZ, partial [Alphaproteobacteria bacterium]